jgi:hypothetical protein
MFNTKEKLQDEITNRLTVIAKEMLVTNSPAFNLRTEQKVSRISKDIDVFGISFGKEDEVFIRFRLLVDVLQDKLKNRRLLNNQ